MVAVPWHNTGIASFWDQGSNHNAENRKVLVLRTDGHGNRKVLISTPPPKPTGGERHGIEGLDCCGVLVNEVGGERLPTFGTSWTEGATTSRPSWAEKDGIDVQDCCGLLVREVGGEWWPTLCSA